MESDYSNPDHWELVNDDGFVFKRKKRSDPTTVPPPPDPALERRHRRERKKRALLKLKDKYANEIRHWELLSNTFKEMEKNTCKPVEETHQTTSLGGSDFDNQSESSSARRSLVDELLAQVEAQEAIIRDVSNLCDVAEALFNAHEERLKNQFTDLPVWEPSPNDLMKALSEQ